MKPTFPVILTMVIFLCISLSSSCQMTKNSISPQNQQTGMYSYRNTALTGYKYCDNIGNLKKKIIITRNNKGQIIEKHHYNATGDLIHKFLLEYDNAERLTRKTKLSSDGKIKKDNLYSYDNNGYLKKQQVVGHNNQLLKTHIYVFNHSGQRVQKTTLDQENNIKRTRLYLYDSQERRFMDYSVSADGNIVSATQYKYNNSSDIAGIFYSDGQGKKKGHAVITYDSQHRRLKKERFNAQNQLSSILYHIYD